jgi:hypothetical protein
MMKTNLLVGTLALAIAIVADPIATVAQTTTETGTCKLNQAEAMNCTVAFQNNGRFSMTWKDGVSDTYRWVGANAEQFNIVDRRGGRWHFSDARNCRDFSLTNLDNNNVITFTGHQQTC